LSSSPHSSDPIRVVKTGYDLIRDPLLNKGTGFTPQEREQFGLHGLLPHEQNTMEQQARRNYNALHALEHRLDQYVSLTALQDRNEQLFYRVLMEHLEEFMPIIYTPTVGLATQNFSHVYRRGRGVWITPDFKGHIAEILGNAVGSRHIRLIVATDNESILGIGDQGAGGMAISVGKLALYVAGAGIHPAETLPVSLDVGTNNTDLLNDELYLGWRNERLRGDAYDELIDEFVEAVRTVCPDALLQWEDFRKDNALEILNRHRDSVPSFNDDIQGTGAVALAGVLTALKVTGAAFTEQRVLIFGAGAAGLGITRQVKAALLGAGVTEEAALAQVGVIDSQGLLVEDRAIRDAYKAELAWTVDIARSAGLPDPAQRDFESVVAHYRPTVLIGSSGQAGAFTEAIAKSMARVAARPIILPFSNPTDRAEATPHDLLNWTEGRALVATGSPFEPVTYGGREFKIGQGNNVFIFPGLGLGALESRATRVTDAMVSAASAALTDAVTADELKQGLLFPAVDRLREISRNVAIAVARQAEADGVASRPASEVEDQIEQAMWLPSYRDYVPA
jgi:malic enzyme